MPTKQQPKKRKTSRPISLQTPNPPSSKLDAVPERQSLLKKLEKRVRRIPGWDKMQYVENPPGEDKMSEILGKFIQSHTRFATDTPSYKRLVETAVVAWNAALLPQDERANMLTEISKNFDEETREDFYTVVGELIERKERHFAKYTRTIIDVQVTDLGDSYHLAVVSLIKQNKE